MSVTLKTGDVVNAKLMKSGQGQKGPWAFVQKKAEKGYDTITIWAVNPDDIKDAGAVKVLSIEEASITNTKKETPSGPKWYTNYNVRAKLEKVEGYQSGDQWVTAEDDLEDIFNL